MPSLRGGELTHGFTVHDLPLFTNVTAESKEEALRAPLGELTIMQCMHCGFVFNADFQPERVAYCQGYHAERGDSPVYCAHINHVASMIQKTLAVSEGTVLEIGCGTGEFLQTMDKTLDNHFSLFGVDPSVQPHQEGRIRFDSHLFDWAYLPYIPSDMVLLISRHMIEHVVNPLDMLRLFAAALPENGVLYLETPRLDSGTRRLF